MSEKQRGAVLVNLIDVARADGRVTAAEERALARIALALGVL